MTMLRGCPTPTPQLVMFQERLRALQSRSSALKSFSRFINHQLSPDVINTINASRALISEFLKSLSDNIARTEDEWRHYGVRSDDGKLFDIYPSLFIDRQRQYLKLLENRVQFQEMMAYSQ